MPFWEEPQIMPFDEKPEDPTRLLKSGTTRQFEDLAVELNTRDLLRTRLLRHAEPLDVAFLQAVKRFPNEAFPSLLQWLQAAMNQPPSEAAWAGLGVGGRDRTCKLPPFVISCLTLPCTNTQRFALCCLRNLARLPPLRAELGRALPRLLELLEVEELRGTAAGALCNVACEATVRPKARVAVPKLLSALPSTGAEDEAEDMVAALGVLAVDADAAMMDSMVEPLLARLPQELTMKSLPLIGLTLEVFIDLVRASGPGGSVSLQLAQDTRLAVALVQIFQRFSMAPIPRLAPDASMRAEPHRVTLGMKLTTALKLCVLLQEGLEALRSVQKSLALDRPEGENLGLGLGGYGGGKALKFCQLRCVDPSCGDCEVPSVPKIPGAPPSKQEIVQQLLSVLADLQNRQGLLGTFACLLGVAITVMGFVGIASPLVTLDALPLFHMGSPALPGPTSTGDREDLVDTYDASSRGIPTTRWASGRDRADRESDWGSWIEPREPEVSHLHVDFSLIALIITLLAVCVLPPLLKSPSLSTPGEGMLNRPSATGGAQLQQFPLSDLLGGQPGRLIDVKPGEMLAGSQSGGLFASASWTAGTPWNSSPWGSSNLWGTGVAGPGQTNAMDWTATAPSWQPPMASNQGWSAPGSGFGQGVGPIPGATSGLYGSWNTAVPSPYSGRGLNAPQSTGLAAASGPAPNEAEVQETYATFGEQLQQWAPAIAAALDQEVISQVLQQLEQSDQMWHQALGPRGWRLSTELPQTGRTAYGLGGTTQEISVFERNLPKPFCDDPQANQLWQRRQQLEKFLVHPLYGPTVRQYVLERLRDWRQRGILNATRHDTWRPNPNMPTDAHILENLVFQTLNLSMEFCDCFLAAGQAPPRVGG
eukprot:s20_g18.t1